MRKNLLVILACTLIALCVISCDDPKHEHSYGTEWKYDATNHWHECECGAKKDEAAHTWSKWENAEDLSSSSRSCSVCNRTEKRDGVVSWDGTVYSWETVYSEDNSKGFLDYTDGNKINVKIPDSIQEAHKTNAGSFITFFKTNLLDTNKITIDTNNCTAKPATVTINSADALASLGLLDRYFAALSMTETDTAKSTYFKSLFNTGSGSNVMVYVNTDMDLGGGNWSTVRSSYPIDFQGYTIYNLKCIHTDDDYVGLFGGKSFIVSISNLVIKNAQVEGNHYVGILCSNGTFRTMDIKNIEIYDSSVKGFKWVGGVIGHAYVGTISNVTLDNVTVVGDDRTEGKEDDIDTSYQVGGIAGFLLYGNIESCTVKNSSIKASKEAGGIAGRTYIQDEVPINVRNNIVTTTKVTNLEGLSADSFIGYKNAYLGFISGGKYLGLTEATDTYEGYPNSDNANIKLTIKANTVDGVKK